MARTFYVNCDFCGGMMEVDAASGKVIQKWETGKQDGAGEDRMAAALRKLEEDKKKRMTLLDKATEEIQGQKKRSAQTFQQEVERIKREGMGERPESPFDRD